MTRKPNIPESIEISGNEYPLAYAGKFGFQSEDPGENAILYATVMVDEVPVITVTYRGGKPYGNSQEIAEVAVNSYIESGGKYAKHINPSIECKEITKFNIDMFDPSECEAQFLNSFDTPRYIVQSEPDYYHWQFTVFDQDLCKQINTIKQDYLNWEKSLSGPGSSPGL